MELYRFLHAEGVKCNSRGQRPRLVEDDLIPTLTGSQREIMRPLQGRRCWVVVDPGASLRFAPGYFLGRFQRPTNQLTYVVPTRLMLPSHRLSNVPFGIPASIRARKIHRQQKPDELNRRRGPEGPED